jgi:hypothetical protein
MLVVAVLGMAASPSSSPELLEKALQSYGAQDYGKARSLLEAYTSAVPQEAGFVYYYIGDCYYRQGDNTNAQVWLKRAVKTGWNKQEALWRLYKIAEKSGAKEEQSQYAALLDRFKEDLEEVTLAAHHLPPPGPDGLIRTPIGLDNRYWAKRYLEWGHVGDAIIKMEYWEGAQLPVELHLRTNGEKSSYDWIASTCREWAGMLRERKAAPGEIEAVEAKARHYELKAMVMEARTAAGKLKEISQKEINRRLYGSPTVGTSGQVIKDEDLDE